MLIFTGHSVKNYNVALQPKLCLSDLGTCFKSLRHMAYDTFICAYFLRKVTFLFQAKDWNNVDEYGRT